MVLKSKPLPSPGTVIQSLSPSSKQLEFVEKARQQLRSILAAKEPRQILIVGPCSIHDIEAAHEFADKLSILSKEVAPYFFIAMRVYFEKARTTTGWKGLLYDPHLDSSNNIEQGIKKTRKLLLDLTEKGIAIASELLDPIAALYFKDLITWGSIGARTCTSQIHRQLAASLPMPVGFKNSTEGDISLAINGILAAITSHTYFGVTMEGKLAAMTAAGNEDSHIVLRGGKSGANFHAGAVENALKALKNVGLPERLLIDCAHGNTSGCHKEQIPVFRSIIQQIIGGNERIRGILMESHLNCGSQILGQNQSKLRYGVSLTDPCIDWKTTNELILWAAEQLCCHQRALLNNAATGT